MNAYLLELLTCLFRLCFNQCNASLHFRSSKHSSYFQKPILPLLVAMGLWSHVLSPLWLLSRLSFVVSAVASSSTSPIYDHISCTARVVFHSLRVVHLTTNWPSCFHSLCIRLYASDFSCDYPKYTSCFSTAQHPCIPAVDLFSRVFTPTVVCDLASGRLFYFFCLLSTALNTSSCESFAVFHTISRAVSYMRLANLKNRNGLRVRWVKCSIDPTDFWCEAITS